MPPSLRGVRHVWRSVSRSAERAVQSGSSSVHCVGRTVVVVAVSVLDRVWDPHPPEASRWLPSAVPASAAAVVMIRLLSVHAAPAPDEGGFLMVAAQWAHGTSLYGDYWVDRPPLLIGIFRLADLGGGLVALRLLGIVAAVAALVLLAGTARRVFGGRAAVSTAIVAAALLSSPLFGSREVNGELLALPFVALGLRAAVEAVLSEDLAIAQAAAVACGAAAAASLMVKQNIADVAVFAVIAWVVGCPPRRTVRLLGAAVVGSAVLLVAVLLAAMSRGTSPLPLFEALYPFRLHAAQLIASSAHGVPTGRALTLLGGLLLTGAPVVVLAFGRYARRSVPRWIGSALLAMVIYDVLSMAAGGVYWLHYEVELLPAVALMASGASRWSPSLIRMVATAMVCSALASTLVATLASDNTDGTAVAAALRPAVRPGDTMVSAFGEADIPWATGTSSPYPYLWSLPSRVLDPGMVLLRGLLSGRAAPTWVVVRGSGTAQRLADDGVLPLLQHRYREVAVVRDREIFLRTGVDRPAIRP